MAAATTMFGFRKTNQKILGTTLGWDGKDYAGEGRLWSVWEREGSDKTFTRIYDRSHKCWCFLELTARLSTKGIQIFELACYFEA